MAVITMEEMWELAYGDASLVDFLIQTPGLHELLRDVEFETELDDSIGAFAGLDRDDSRSNVIRITTGTHTVLRARLERCCRALSEKTVFPWLMLGWRDDAFDTQTEFVDYLLVLCLGFISMHELSHIARGHVDKYAKTGNLGLFEMGARAQTAGVLPPHRRQALELDADSVAVYYYATLNNALLSGKTHYQRAPNYMTMVASVSFRMRIVFGIFSEMDPIPTPTRELNLEDFHKGRQHPHPSLREMFAHVRFAELASPGSETRAVERGIKRSQDAFLAATAGGAFLEKVLEAHLFPESELLEFTHTLVDEIQLAAAEGWMDDDSRVDRSMRAVEMLFSSDGQSNG